MVFVDKVAGGYNKSFYAENDTGIITVTVTTADSNINQPQTVTEASNLAVSTINSNTSA